LILFMATLGEAVSPMQAEACIKIVTAKFEVLKSAIQIWLAETVSPSTQGDS
jgi:hypothetical protein